jgi:hypothetical protein
MADRVQVGDVVMRVTPAFSAVAYVTQVDGDGTSFRAAEMQFYHGKLDGFLLDEYELNASEWTKLTPEPIVFPEIPTCDPLLTEAEEQQIGGGQ